MKIVRFLLPALLVAGCDSGGVDTAAPQPPSGEVTPTDEAAETVEPSSNDGASLELQTTPEPPEARWNPCESDFVASIRQFPVRVNGEDTTLGERLDAGAVAASIESLDDSFRDGTWMCFEGGDQRLLEYRAALNGVDFGPQWILADAHTLQPNNLLAEALHGAWSATSGADDSVRAVALQCRVGGNWLTSGAYSHLRADEAQSPQWTVLPDVREGRAETYRAVLSWRGASGRQSAVWRVVMGGTTCEPLTEPAQRITDMTGAIPRHREQLAGGSPRPSNRPSEAHSERGRALAYAFAEGRELQTIMDHLKFRERPEPFDVGEWEVSVGPDGDGLREVSLRVQRSEPLTVSYGVHPGSGATTPRTPETSLARAVLPLRSPGVGDISRVPLRLEQDVIDAHLGPVLGALGACIPRGGESISIVWWTAWDGHTYDIESDPANREVSSCVVEVVGELQFPQFRGPAVRASSVVSAGR